MLGGSGCLATDVILSGALKTVVALSVADVRTGFACAVLGSLVNIAKQARAQTNAVGTERATHS